jgi:hypothetical protein
MPLQQIKCGWCDKIGIPTLAQYGLTTCQFICQCGHQLSIPKPEELVKKYNILLGNP